MLLLRAVLLLVLALARGEFGGTAPAASGGGGENVPTTQPTTSQPTGFKAPSVPGEELLVPLVDYTAQPSPPSVAPPPAQYPNSNERPVYGGKNSFAGAENVNQDLASENVTAMASVGYIFSTFLATLATVGGCFLYRRSRERHLYSLATASSDSESSRFR